MTNEGELRVGFCLLFAYFATKTKTMRFFLVSTDCLKDRLLFIDDVDFRVGMNCVAIAAFQLHINVLAFVLMSNHVHFVVECSAEEAVIFAHKFKQLYGRHIHQKYGTIDYLRKLRVDVQELMIEDESLQRGIAYVQMNPVAANITPTAVQYPWGSGPSFFNVSPGKGVEIGSLSLRKQNALLGSRVILPASWLLGPDGYILQESFVHIQFVEALYRTPNSYSYFLNTSSKARARLEKDPAPSFRDQIILAAIPDLCRSLYRSDGLDSLSPEQSKDIIRQLKRRFSMDIKQLARVTGMSPSVIAEMLESF